MILFQFFIAYQFYNIWTYTSLNQCTVFLTVKIWINVLSLKRFPPDEGLKSHMDDL